RAFLAADRIDSASLWRFLSHHLGRMPAGLVLPSALDTHDAERFLRLATGDTRRLKLAALVQFALPHPPVLLYGTEVGPGHRQEPRGPMVCSADQDRGLRSFYRALIHWRKAHGIFATSPELVHAGNNGLLVLRLDPWFVAVNRSEEAIALDFGQPGDVWLALGSEFDVQLHGSALQLPVMSGAILRSAGAYH